MSTSGIRNNGLTRPITPKEIIPDKKKSEKAKSEDVSTVKDSFKISNDGLKLDKVLKELSNVKSFLSNSNLESEKLINAAANGLKAESIQEEVANVSEILSDVTKNISENPTALESVHNKLKPENVLALEKDSIEELTEVFDVVEKYIAENPGKALNAQGNL